MGAEEGGGSRWQIELRLEQKEAVSQTLLDHQYSIHGHRHRSPHTLQKKKKKKKKAAAQRLSVIILSRLAGSMLWKLVDQCSAVNNEYIQWRNSLACSAKSDEAFKQSVFWLFILARTHDEGATKTKLQSWLAQSIHRTTTWADKGRRGGGIYAEGQRNTGEANQGRGR